LFAQPLKAGVLVGILAGICALGLVGIALLAVADAEAHTCRTQAQSISKLHNVSCRRAKKVARKARNATYPTVPECRGDHAKKWNGWRLTPKPIGGIGIGTKFKKGRRSFVLSGGGTC
jgi:hypothetical protein